MRVTRWVGIFLLVVLVVSPAAAGKKSLMDEVREIGDVISEAMTSGDPEKMFAHYAADPISLPNYAPRMDGLEAFRKHHAEMTGSGLKILSFESEPTDVWKAGAQVIEIGTFTIKMSMPGMPGTIDDRGKYMTVYVRERGALKIKAEIWNTDVNPMAAMHGGDEHAGHDHG